MKYTDTHEWIKLDEKTGIAVVGITDYAQKELGDLVYIEFPTIGEALIAGDEIIILESTKAAIDLYTPLTGQVVEINSDLQDAPERINSDPTGEGWLYKIKLADFTEYKDLLDESAYQQLISGDDS